MYSEIKPQQRKYFQYFISENPCSEAKMFNRKVATQILILVIINCFTGK